MDNSQTIERFNASVVDDLTAQMDLAETKAEGRGPIQNSLTAAQHLPFQSYRRPRFGSACATCHARKVRCDANLLGKPCTNCMAFSIDCVAQQKCRKPKPVQDGKSLSRRSIKQPCGRQSREFTTTNISMPSRSLELSSPRHDTAETRTVDERPKYPADGIDTYAKLVKLQTSISPIKEPGRVAYLAEMSNMALLANDYVDRSSAVHYPLQENPKSLSVGVERLDETDLRILRQRGALSLPSQATCDQLIDAYFEWVAPIVPIINKTCFMQRYRDPNNPPSILLLQAILLAGCKVCSVEDMSEIEKSRMPTATDFYTRAKALYDADYENDRVAIVQALILMGWYWEDPGYVPKNVFYWNGLAVTIAQGFGIHRNADESQLSKSDKRLWKRIWWTLFTRDRSVAVALGRPVHIHMEDSDVERLCVDDFNEDGEVYTAPPPDLLHVQFFLQYIKICEIIDMVLLQQYSALSRSRPYDPIALFECDMALAEWLQDCPKEMRWEVSRHHFWSALLHSTYHTTYCLLHRTHLPDLPHPQQREEMQQGRSSWYPEFQSASAITAVIEALSMRGELSYTPPSLIYSLLTALTIHIYRLHVADLAADSEVRKEIRICMHALRKISEVWLVAKMVNKIFESILRDKGFEDCVTETTGNVVMLNWEFRDSRSEELINYKYNGTAMPLLQRTHTKALLKEMDLTPALLLHMSAALKSAKIPAQSDHSGSSGGIAEFGASIQS